MSKYLFIFCVLAGLCFGQASQSTPAAKCTLPDLIGKYRTDKNSVFNTPKVNPAARVFFIYSPKHLHDEADFKKEINFLIPIHKEISKAGAEIIIEEGKDEKYLKKHGPKFRRLCRSSKLKCPFVNSLNKEIKDTIYQSRGGYPSFSYPNLRATDACGMAIAYFVTGYLKSTGNKIITMKKCYGKGESRVICTAPDNDAEWISACILETYKELLAEQVLREAEAHTGT